MPKLEDIACTGAVLVLPDGRWVMQRRTDDAPTDPNKLSFFGGKTEEGETPSQCFEREMQEETDLDLKKLGYKQATEFEVEHYGRMLAITLFRVNIPNINFAVYEGKWAEAFTVDELAKHPDTSMVTHKAIEMITEKRYGA